MKEGDDTEEDEGGPKVDSCVDRICRGNRCFWVGIVSSIQIRPLLSDVIVENEGVSAIVDWSNDQHIVFIIAKIVVVGSIFNCVASNFQNIRVKGDLHK